MNAPHKHRFTMIALVILWPSLAWPQNTDGLTRASPNIAQIIAGMERHDQMQAKELSHYQSRRHYSLVYRGFGRNITADMEAEIQYDSAVGKSFRIVSQSGSHTLCEKVLKRALESEKEASLDRHATALTPANYRFRFVGTDRLGNRFAYILEVEPIMPSKFLYTGKVWVDSTDFAVAKMEVQPAKNPSFWISRTLVHHTNAITDGFWLPKQNRSETKIWIGGTAVMTIEYGAYQIGS
jgi:hypothetical protein